MSHLKLMQYKSILLGFCGGVATIVVQPAIAQDLTAKETNANQVNVASIAASTAVSTKANDLLLPAIKQPKYFIDVQQTTYQARQLDLAKFCQNYPYNSKCKGANTGLETEADDVSVPNSSDNSQNSTKPKSGWAIAPEISTLGLGGHVIRRIIPNLNARVGLNAFGVGFEIEDDSSEATTTYDVDLNLLNVSTLVDYHPFKSSGFKMTSGLVFNNNNIEGTATTDGEIEIGDQTYTANEVGSVDTEIEVTRSVAPYLGIGWGNAVKASKGLGFWFNLGLMFGGSPDIEVTPNINQNLPQAQREQLEAEVNQEIDDEEKEIEDDLAVMDVYPVGTIGISYQF
jgi:hypothetical protein